MALAGCGQQTAADSGGALSSSQQTGDTEEAAQPVSTQTPPPAEATPSVPPTFTSIPTVAGTATPGPSETPEPTLTPSTTPTATPVPSETPTSVPLEVPVLVTYADWSNDAIPATATPPTAIPSPVPTFELPDSVINVLLLGSDDQVNPGTGLRTDTMIIVSINTEEKTASMLSLPRDLFIYFPGKRMTVLNTIYDDGASTGDEHGGFEALRETILYNFGIPIHYYALVNFDGFKTIVDTVGGVEVAVSCQLRDWRLKEPDLDPLDEENWYMYTLETGMQMLDGDMALWYARSRTYSTDLHRARRQQQLLHALLNQGVRLGLISELPSLWQTYNDTVETNMDIGRMLQLATIAPAIQERGVQHVNLRVPPDLIQWDLPSGKYTLLPNWETAQDTFARLLLPPTLNRASRLPVLVEVINHTGNPEMGELAADNLAWFGFIPTITEEDGPAQETTEITYFANNFKGSYDWLMSWVFDMYQSEIDLNNTDTYSYDYQVVLGEDYNPCRPLLYSPRENLDTE
jgi:LCP family protein required for cell wall assembly